MEKVATVIIAINLLIVSVSLISCSENKQVNSRVHTENSMSSKDAKSIPEMKTPVLKDIAKIRANAESESETGFGIFLEENNELILSDKHLKSYDKDTHEIELNVEGIKKWNSYRSYGELADPPVPKLWDLDAKKFIVKVNGKEIYRGKFWSRLSSAICSEIVILDTAGALEDKIDIDYGYPLPSNTGKDFRNNPEVIGYFRKHGLLK
jgi:hypothetical protein